MRTRRGIAILLLLALAAGIIHRAWRSAPRPRSISPALQSNRGVTIAGPTMGSTWSVVIGQLPANVSTEEARVAVQAVFDRIDGMMSTYKPESHLSRFNASRSTDWQSVPEELVFVVAEAQHASEESGGAFDVTVGPLVNLWGFGSDQSEGRRRAVPSADAIASARQHVGYQKLHGRQSPSPALKKDDPAMYVDLSGIAKGYGVDAVAKRLDELAVTDYLVEAGGELRSKGKAPSGQPWHVGIETPSAGAHRILHRVELTDRSIATSGDYRNFFDADGKRYSHEINPATGAPIENGVASVSVVAPTCARADALATAMMILGPERGLPIAEKLDTPVMFLMRRRDAFDKRATAAFEQLLVDAPRSQPTTRAP